MSEEKEGWVCPICKTVYSPDIKECKKCTKNEQTSNDTRQLLTE